MCQLCGTVDALTARSPRPVCSETASNTRAFEWLSLPVHTSPNAQQGAWRLLSPITLCPNNEKPANSHRNQIIRPFPLFSPSFRLFGVDSCQRDATATRILSDAAGSPMTSRCRHTCRGTSKPTIVLVVAALDCLCSFSSPPPSTLRPAGPLEARS